jgi:hypothetical protein
MFAKAIMAAQAGRIDGWWIGSSTEYDSQRVNSRDGSGLNHASQAAHRSSTHSSALDNAFRFIDGMTKGRAVTNRSFAGRLESTLEEVLRIPPFAKKKAKDGAPGDL